MSKSAVTLKGFTRLKIGKTNKKTGKLKIVADTDWCENTFTQIGMRDAIMRLFAASAGSQLPGSMILATQATAVNSTQSTLTGQGATGLWEAVNKSTSTAAGPAGTYEMTASFAGSDWNSNIAAVGIYASTAGQLLSGATFSGGASNFDTGQTASVTYQWRVS